MNGYIMLLDLGVTLTKSVLSAIKGHGADGVNTLLDVGQSFIDAIETHKQDVLTKANFDAQRG